MPANWQLPPGVNRGLWDYLHDPGIARGYDAGLADCRLVNVDHAFVQRHCRTPGRLLDLGCGTGRLLLPLAGKGYWVVGVDLSEEMLKITSEKAAAVGVVVRLLKANLVDLAGLDDRAFDYAACLFSTLGMVVGADKRRRVVDHVYRLLRPEAHSSCTCTIAGSTCGTAPRVCGSSRIPCLRCWGTSRTIAPCPPTPAHQGIGGLILHMFTRRETLRLLRDAGFRIREVMPLSLRSDGRLPLAAFFGRLRAYGYLIAAEKP